MMFSGARAPRLGKVRKKRKSRQDQPVSLYREGEDPAETLRALLEVKTTDTPPEDQERQEA